MLPIGQTTRPRVIWTFDVVTPTGHVYTFPRPTLLQHLLRLLSSHAETAVVSGIVFGMICSAGFLGEAVGSLQFENCKN